MKGFSPRNLKYMRALAAAWPNRSFVQQAAAQVPWFHNCLLLDRATSAAIRVWYIQSTTREGWSRNILVLQIDGRAHGRQGRAITNLRDTLPPAESDVAAQVFKEIVSRVETAKLDVATCLRRGFGRQVAANLPARRSPSEGGKELRYGG